MCLLHFSVFYYNIVTNNDINVIYYNYCLLWSKNNDKNYVPLDTLVIEFDSKLMGFVKNFFTCGIIIYFKKKFILTNFYYLYYFTRFMNHFKLFLLYYVWLRY